MKKLIVILLILTAGKTQAQELKLNTPFPCILWLSDTSRTATGNFKTATAMVKQDGFIVYVNVSDTLNPGTISFFYLDKFRKVLDKKFYIFPFSGVPR